MVEIENIHLRTREFFSLLSVKIKKKKQREKIKYFEILCNQYALIEPIDDPVVYDSSTPFTPCNMYCVSDRYYRYMIYRRKQIMSGNVLVSSLIAGIISIIASVLTTLIMQYL